jgi:S-formylglutathione hydrolase FrmB
VIELLHGTPGTPEDWTRAGFADVTADGWAATHSGVAPVIVMPDPNGGFTTDTECLDSHPGRAETYLVQDVPDWVTSHEGTTGRWAIAGSSEGGYCASVLGLRHADRYVAFADFSGLDRPTHSRGMRWLLGPTRSVSDYSPGELLRAESGPAPAAWFEVGGADGGTHRAVVRLAGAARDAGLDTRLVVLPRAHHTWRVWRRSFQDALPWLMERLSGGR